MVHARATFRTAHTLSAADRTLSAAHIIIATGGRPLVPPLPGAQLGITSDGFFELPERPQRVAIVGSSYIAVELAGIFAGLGSQTTLSLRGETVLRGFDAMLGEATLGNLRGQGVEVVTGAMPARLERARGRYA